MSSFKLSWKYDKSFCFFFLEGEVKVPYTSWEKLRDAFVSELTIIKEFIDNGFGTISNDECFIETEYILSLPDFDKLILGLPDSYPYDIYIQANGVLNENTVVLDYDFYDYFPHGNRLAINRTGPLIELETRHYLLSKNQYLLCESLDNFNLLPADQKTAVRNYKSFADIKSLSREAACLLDSYLEAENIAVPANIKVEIINSNGILELVPDLGIGKESFLRNFDIQKEVKDNYRVLREDGQSVRIVIDDDLKSELKKIKSKRKISDESEIESIIENPDLFFDGDKVDLAMFYSDRVKEIGFYKPKFYPFVCPYKSEWIPGIEIRDKVDGTKRIYFKSDIEITEFEELYQDAIRTGANSFEYKGSQIDLETAKKTVNAGRKIRKDVERSDKEMLHELGNEVLIIHENADVLEYTEVQEIRSELEHKFCPVENLNSGIRLKEHQIEGIAWLQTLLNSKIRGCLLADDMGLGKTLQLLYFIEWHSQLHLNEKPYLIVAPVALLENWQNEYKRFFSEQTLELKLVYGQTGMSKELNDEDLSRLQKRQLILTNYETLRTYQFTLCAVDYSVVVLDEAQKIKTPGTQITNVSKAIKADFKIAMTGTPVENTLIDLWSIIDFSAPGLLGNAKEFARKYQSPLKEADADLQAMGEQLRSEIGIFLKRRLKKDVARDLPKKYDNDRSRIKREMPPVQWERYNMQIELATAEDVQGVDRRNQILRAIWAIRDISDHPFLLSEQISSYSSDELISTSAKLMILVDLLGDIQFRKEKVIIFADRKETQKMLQKVVYEKFNMASKIINGDTPTTARGDESLKQSRQQAIDEFQKAEGFNVIIMSQLAAGVGLNVTGANHVIHYSRHWNPAKEEQATDRAYRIGQEKDVYVYYPMAVFPGSKRDKDGKTMLSFDEILDTLLSNKKNLASATLFPSDRAEVTPDELFGSVFGMKSDHAGSRINIDIVDKLTPSLFEAFVACLYKARGYEVYLTPNTNDKGADVVAIGENDCLLIQAKQTSSTVNIDGVREIVAAKGYYSSKFNTEFSCAVVTNRGFAHGAVSISKANNVSLIGREYILDSISLFDITMKDILMFERKRMARV